MPASQKAFVVKAADAGLDHVCTSDHVNYFVGAGFDGLVNAAALALAHSASPCTPRGAGAGPAGARRTGLSAVKGGGGGVGVGAAGAGDVEVRKTAPPPGTPKQNNGGAEGGQEAGEGGRTKQKNEKWN